MLKEWWWLWACCLVGGVALAGIVSAGPPVQPAHEYECYHLAEVTCYRVTPVPREAHDAEATD